MLNIIILYKKSTEFAKLSYYSYTSYNSASHQKSESRSWSYASRRGKIWFDCRSKCGFRRSSGARQFFFSVKVSGLCPKLWIWALREKKKTWWHLHQTCFRRVSSKSNVYCKPLATFGTPIALILIENEKFLFRHVMVSIFLIASCLPQWTHSSSSCLNIFKVYFSLKYLRQNWGDYLFNCDFRTKLKMKKMWNKVSIKLRCVEISSKPRVDGLHGSWLINLNMSSTCEEKSRPRNYFESQMSP